MEKGKSALKRIRSAVIGYGGAYSMGKEHMEQMQMAGMQPVSVCDLDESRLKIAEKDFPGIRTYTSVAEMLNQSDFDLVTIITPHNTHSRLAVQCLKAKKHVVVEKPLALSTAECDRMIAAAAENRRLLSTYHNRHWDGCILQALKKTGSIGDIVRIEAHMGSWSGPREWWRSSRSISGGILFDWGVHLLEYTLQLMNAEVVEVSGFTKDGVWNVDSPWKEDTVEDEGFILVRYSDGRWSSLLLTSLDASPREGWLDILGTKGSYRFDSKNWSLTIPKREGVSVLKGENPPSRRELYYRNIADHLAGKEKLIITADWARRPIHIIDLAYRSAAKGTSIRTKYR